MFSANQLIYYRVLGNTIPPEPVSDSHCYLCGGDALSPIPTKKALGSKFTDYASARGDIDTGVCEACVWSLTDKNADIGKHFGKTLGLRLFSHTVDDNNEWRIYSKAHKADIVETLFRGVIPQICIISTSGQKHLLFKARVNPQGQSTGWVMFENEHLMLDAGHFAQVYQHVDALYQAGFNKDTILSGNIFIHKREYVEVWRTHYPAIALLRGQAILELAVYLVTKKGDVDERDDEGVE